MPDIVLTTLNAKYIHASVGLRYLMANLGELAPCAALLEFDINQRPIEIVEALLATNPKIVGFGIYIWNVTQATEVVTTLKRLRPDVVVILGGPEVSFEWDTQEIVAKADYVITGEADLKFAEICRGLLSGQTPASKIIPAELPDLKNVELPYKLYDEDDVAHRVIYVEASRGCPFSCEFCLSSLDIPVRQFPLETLLPALDELYRRGVQQFKFVDRTFNLNIAVSRQILEFFLARQRPGLFVHFEMIPDRLPEALREVIPQFPPGALQFEVGIQTFDTRTAANISRRQDYSRLHDNLTFLREHTGIHVHADLIVGLPGESIPTFAAGFDRLVALQPQEIQVGILKRLRGTPIVRHDQEWQMVYNPHPPYEILQNKLIDFFELQRMRRFARYWDLIANSGNFIATTPLLLQTNPSAFTAFATFSDWLYARAGQHHSIALARLMEWVFDYLRKQPGIHLQSVAEALRTDYQRGGRNDTPSFLREHVAPLPSPLPSDGRGRRRSRHQETPAFRHGPKRQARHLVSELKPINL